jgi:hypothetical protein
VSRHDLFVIEGVHEAEPALFCQLERALERFRRVAVKDDLSTVSSAGLHLRARRLFRHDDDGGYAGCRCCPRDGLGVVAGGDGHDALGPLLVRKGEHAPQGASHFECPGLLEVLTLQVDGRAHALR